MKLWRNHRLQRFECDWPMCEQQIMPDLHHDPRPRRERPRPVRDGFKRRMQAPNCSGVRQRQGRRESRSEVNGESHKLKPRA
jgi:hypothetical protein